MLSHTEPKPLLCQPEEELCPLSGANRRRKQGTAPTYKACPKDDQEDNHMRTQNYLKLLKHKIRRIQLWNIQSKSESPILYRVIMKLEGIFRAHWVVLSSWQSLLFFLQEINKDLTPY